ncbi:hypothetical protein GLYMA_07G005400v4 [Glycine max]|uniref:Uncharacterized protein n=1 Tax=Glycine max TaxID=3847 RepID=A0A0R0J3M4_SOYBN|nr:hypothetical protein JHK85_017606 [Glycine max]KAG5036379.1 hypothetical protein JHK86_017219 [Glycine max]KAH1084658.1 hypothetical protein GYH30_016986 [Glycine max]KRH47043.1 hypothetical protein GLYMA_07G005400v4 [Glycine max]
MEAGNHGSAAYGGRKSRQRRIWRSEIAAAPLHGGSRQLMVFLSFFLYFFSLCTFFFLPLQLFLFDRDCVGIYSWGFGLWVLLM